MRQRDLVTFFAITYLITWGIAGMYVFAPGKVVPLFGNLTGAHPLYFLANWAPAIAAFSLILYRHGFAGLRRYLSRLLLWRASLCWWGLVIVGVPLIYYVGASFKGGDYPPLFPFESVPAFLLALLMFVFKGPTEEFGWRGFALPLLQQRMAPIWAGLVVGVVWSVWHTPAFLLSVSVYSTWSFAPFFLGTVAVSVIMTPMFNRSRGSILLPALFHLQLINPLWPDAQPYDNWIMIAIAVVVVWFNRATMFSRQGGITEVVPD
ncbi:MAG: CPBP family intramembrane glutamic endopeptidase [Acidiferrobacterales bacterium]